MGDMGMFYAMIRHIDDYTRIVQVAETREEAMEKIIALYPDYGEADFFLKYSIYNHISE